MGGNMKEAERKEKIKSLVNIRECIEYLEERVRLSPPEYAAVIKKNLHYTKMKEKTLCKQIGFGDSTNSSTTSQHLKGKA
jgi:hypothetical protein